MTWWRNPSWPSDPQVKAVYQRQLRDIVHALSGASAARDPDLIAELLAGDVEILVDSGGAVPVPAHDARGPRASAELILEIVCGYSRLSITEHEINGGPGILLKEDGVLVGVMKADVRRGAICDIWVILNPDKLISLDVD